MERSVRVLVVDDDETFCQLLAEVLESKGINVAWTTDGLEGYSRILRASSLDRYFTSRTSSSPRTFWPSRMA